MAECKQKTNIFKYPLRSSCNSLGENTHTKQFHDIHRRMHKIDGGFSACAAHEHLDEFEAWIQEVRDGMQANKE